MFTEVQLKELAGITTKSPALTVYLNTEPTTGNVDANKLRLRAMLKDVDLKQDVEAVLNYFDANHPWVGQGIGVFSCAGDGIFRTISLGVPVRDQIYIGDRFSVKHLTDLFDVYGGYGVILVDRQGARVFHFHLGELVEQEGALGEQIKHTKLGGASTFPGRRGGVAGRTQHEAETVDRNMREMVDFASDFFEAKHVRRVLIGGTEDTVAQFRTMLPKSWQSLIVGTFPMSMTAPHTEVLSRAMEIGKEAEAARDARLVKSVITQASKGAGAEIGMENTLRAVSQNRVQTLIISRGFHKSAYRCNGCERLTMHSNPLCKECGGKIDEVEDGVELAVSAVMRAGGEVEIVPVTPDFEKAGNFGAILRY